MFSANFQKTAQVSADGKALLFRSQEKLSAYENEGTPELYLYRAGAGVSCVSCDPTGASPLGEPDLGDILPGGANLIPPRTASIASHNLTAEGARVFFETPDPLVGADTNGDTGCRNTPGEFTHRSCLDVYEWEAAGLGSCIEGSSSFSAQDGGCLYLLSTGEGTEPAFLADASESGEDVYFFTSAHLVGQDQDSLQDVYDARALGGLSAQNQPASPPPCDSSEACHEAGSPLPSFQAPPHFQGPGNVTEAPQCKHRFARKHGRCVKKKAHKRHRAKRSAGGNRRAGK